MRGNKKQLDPSPLYNTKVKNTVTTVKIYIVQEICAIYNGMNNLYHEGD